MRIDFFHTYNYDMSKVYNAYNKALRRPPFNKAPELHDKKISIKLGGSMKFWFTGGAMHANFSSNGSKTNVQVRFTLVQCFSGRCKAYDDLLTQKVMENLNAKPMAKKVVASSKPVPKQMNAKPKPVKKTYNWTNYE